LHFLYEESAKGNRSAKIKFLKACNLIGLLEEDKKSWEDFKKSKANLDENFINQKIKDRNSAREKGDYKLADTLRSELENKGVIIEDKENKTFWKYK
ncbi:cysteine--tRNA ligase, partial [Pelagibacteraceae bacterium]|nr:cysteine--tRNA ligase [Pelagibacteraceae bacterium]